jgi:hypothetical protein
MYQLNDVANYSQMKKNGHAVFLFLAVEYYKNIMTQDPYILYLIACCMYRSSPFSSFHLYQVWALRKASSCCPKFVSFTFGSVGVYNGERDTHWIHSSW